jgi:pimeloyl-ACP methyl ester carboxylesterase
MNAYFRRGVGYLGILIVITAIWQIRRAESGLEIVHSEREKVPVTIITPKHTDKEKLPIVLVGHGFAGSAVLMRSFAYPLAYIGYAVVSWDFDGHGQNPRPLPSSVSGSDLLANAELALAEAQAKGIGDPSQIAILGHSMGSGVAMTFGQRYPETAATIAISPVGTPVTPQLPRNLLLLAGENEPNFVRNAQARLAEAGGAGGNINDGTARQLLMIPWVEHITIVFSPQAHAAAKDWLDATFGLQPAAVNYVDWRVIWYGLGVIGALSAGAVFSPPTTAKEISSISFQRRLAALFGGSLGATISLWLFERLGVSLSQSLGLLVGGYLLIWFAVAGVLSLLLMRVQHARIGRPGWQTVAIGFISAAILWLGVGLLGGEVWLPWLLIPQRLVFWPLGVILMLPWFLAVGQASARANVMGRIGWFFIQCIVILVGLFLALQISSGLFFLLLILPVFPFILGAHAVVASRQGDPWAFGLSAAVFICWAVLAVFPLR